MFEVSNLLPLIKERSHIIIKKMAQRVLNKHCDFEGFASEIHPMGLIEIVRFVRWYTVLEKQLQILYINVKIGRKEKPFRKHLHNKMVNELLGIPITHFLLTHEIQ